MKPFSFLRLAALVYCLTACAVPTVTKPKPTAAPPRLVVLITIDGLPQRQVLAYRDQFGPDGLGRFLDRGAWFAQAHYGHGHTVTGAGHATLLTGAYPQRTGIIGNQWRSPANGEPVYCAGDTNAQYIGHPTQPLDGTSPRNLKVDTLGDVLRRADPRAKVLAVSGKDRGAILPAGHLGTAYMYMHGTGQFASTTHYMKAHPAWVNTFNAAKPADAYFRSEWTALLPEAAYAGSLPDRQPWFGLAGGGLPMRYSAPDDEAPGPRFYGALMRGPFGDALTLAFARAALEGEQLGADDVPDVLAISLSGHDYVNHAFSAESRLSHDHLLQLDRQLQAFFQHLDANVGKGQYLAVLTADHGFMPTPEHLAAQGLEAGRANLSQALAQVNLRLAERFGPGRWAHGFSADTLLLNKSLMTQKGLDAETVARAARTLLLSQPGFGVAYTRGELAANSRAGAPLFEAMRKGWHAEVSGDVQFALKPNWMSGSAGATHGSPYAYDTHVPIMFYGPAWVRAGRVDAPADVVDIAPTLARWLGVAAPTAAQGRVLTQVLQ
jgi:predicted AlkP superfamily pyrophosphatase or phosphodiesterase